MLQIVLCTKFNKTAVDSVDIRRILKTFSALAPGEYREESENKGKFFETAARIRRNRMDLQQGFVGSNFFGFLGHCLSREEVVHCGRGSSVEVLAEWRTWPSRYKPSSETIRKFVSQEMARDLDGLWNTGFFAHMSISRVSGSRVQVIVCRRRDDGEERCYRIDEILRCA